MNLKTGLLQQQTLKLTMTQELTQAIALLQYSALELSSFLEEKALENPLIQLDASNIKTMDPRHDRIRTNNHKAEKDQMNWIEQIGGSKQTTLKEYLLSQINLKDMTTETEKVFSEIVDNLDENGYLRVTEREIANNLSVPETLVEETIALIQQLEPAGIGARNLRECLLIQLEQSGEQNELAKQIISDHFLDFADKKWRPLASQLNVSLKDIQDVFDYVQTLNPRPGAAFYDESPAYIVPDVIVEWNGKEFIVKVFDEIIPKVSFNRTYHQQLANYKDDQVKQFLQEKSRDYNWILKSLEQRKETLTKVTLKIIEKQQSFFREAGGQLNPMTMKEISDELDIHESTVSRTVREKYVQTPFGTFALKSFFTSTIQTVSDGSTSSAQVKNEISKLIDEEDKLKPLSDQRIVTLLKEKKGLVISRRTVAKYREQLNIPSSSKRKRFH